MTAERDWAAWHDAYDVPGSSLAQRLAAVQGRIGYDSLRKRHPEEAPGSAG
ncbi:MAG TPA: hypothetical protein VMV92_42520 [Streptosporangiaceae bacterium]|nr:hypothetical protein [Streptosporangiaceae bacterium]